MSLLRKKQKLKLKTADGFIDLKEVPHDVFKVWVVIQMGKPVGKKLIDECKEIMSKYPEYFSGPKRLVS